MKMKVFTCYGSGFHGHEGLEEQVNEWISEQGSMIEIVQTHFSTCSTMTPENGYTSHDVVYSAAIYYREL